VKEELQLTGFKEFTKPDSRNEVVTPFQEYYWPNQSIIQKKTVWRKIQHQHNQLPSPVRASHLTEGTDVQKKYQGYYFSRRRKIGGRRD